MTLNLTLVTDHIVIQASDRKLVSLPSGQTIDDDANKGVVFETDDGLFSVTFAGIGMMSGKRMDEWLAEVIADEGVTELAIDMGLDKIALRATKLFRSIRGPNKQHLFCVAGWQQTNSRAVPRLWTILNARDIDVFEVMPQPIHGNKSLMVFGGLHAAVTRADRRRIEATAKKLGRIDDLERRLVETIRTAAQHPQYAFGISENVLAIALDSVGYARATYYPIDDNASNYAPFFVWYAHGFNVIAGDGPISHPTSLGIQFGRSMLVGPKGGPSSENGHTSDLQQVTSRLRLSDSRFKKEAVNEGDRMDFIRFVQLDSANPGFVV